MEWNGINLGDRVRDRITGFTGIASCKAEWLNSCRRITVQPEELKDGKPIDGCTFDVEDLILVLAGVHPKKPIERETNGPMPEAPRFR